MAKTHHAKLLDQFRERMSICAQVSINGFPDMDVNRVYDFFRATSCLNSFTVVVSW